jgi:hypothetical protein
MIGAKYDVMESGVKGPFLAILRYQWPPRIGRNMV